MSRERGVCKEGSLRGALGEKCRDGLGLDFYSKEGSNNVLT